MVCSLLSASLECISNIMYKGISSLAYLSCRAVWQGSANLMSCSAPRSSPYLPPDNKSVGVDAASNQPCLNASPFFSASVAGFLPRATSAGTGRSSSVAGVLPRPTSAGTSSASLSDAISRAASGVGTRLNRWYSRWDGGRPLPDRGAIKIRVVAHGITLAESHDAHAVFETLACVTASPRARLSLL